MGLEVRVDQMEQGLLGPPAGNRTESRWEYLIPASAGLFASLFSLAVVINNVYQTDLFEHPGDSSLPGLIKASRLAAIFFGSLSLSGIPVSFVATVLQTGYRGCLRAPDGLGVTREQVFEAIKNSASFYNAFKKEGVIINSMAAPFLNLTMLIWASVGLVKDSFPRN